MKRAKKLFTNFLKQFKILFNNMLKVIRLSRYKFDKEHIQHNVTFSVSGLFDNSVDLANERIRIMTTLLETLCPNTIRIVGINHSARPLTDKESSLLNLSLANRLDTLKEGDEIALDQLKDVMFYCYSKAYELELDILDIKNQHVTAVVNRDLEGHHYIYGTPETFSEEYLNSIKKKLKYCTIDGSFRKTL